MTNESPPTVAPTPHGRLASVSATREAAILGALLICVLIAGLRLDSFATGRNAGFLLLDIAAIALIALPMTLVIITGEIDLSVASVLGLSSATMGQLWLAGWPLELIIPACVLLGGLLGMVNGLLVTVAGLPSLAVTIGTMALYRGLAYVVLGDRAVADFPLSWVSGASGTLPGTPIPWIALVILLLSVGFAALLHATATGRAIYAIGANAEAARFSGIAVQRTKMWLFVATGTVSAMAGAFWTLHYGSARADNAMALELSVVAAVLLGGVSIFGGTGALPGVLGGVLLLGTVRNALQLADVSSDMLTVVTGLLLILSVVTPNLVARARAWRARRRSAPHPPPPTR